MYPISAAFAATLQRPHSAIFRADVYDAGVLQRSLDVLAGAVEVDGNADRRRRMRVALAGADLAPADLSGLIAPNGNELRLFRGVRAQVGLGPGELPLFADYWCPVGVFGITEVVVRDTAGGVLLDVQGQDRSRKVSRARWDQAYVIAGGTNVGTALRDLIESRLPGTVYNFALTTATTPLVLLGESRDNDPWKDALAIAQAAGLELYFDADGVCVLRPVPDPAVDAPAWDYVEGEGGLLLALERHLTAETTYNAVVVTGEGSALAAPVRAVVMDTNPASPTYVGNPVGSSDFGFVPRFLTSSLITLQSQAQGAGEAILRTALGSAEDVRFDGIVNPAHEAGDVVTIRRGRAKVDARYVLQAFTIPLAIEASMRATTRKRVV